MHTLQTLYITSSDHVTILLKPAYWPIVRQEPAVGKDIRVWPQEAIPSLHRAVYIQRNIRRLCWDL